MDPGGFGGAFGGTKAGGQVDPLSYIKRPAVVLRICALLSSIVVFGCISSSGWYFWQEKGKEVCVMNTDSAVVCHYATFVGIVGFLASIGFLVGEWFFEQMSSIKSRKHYVILDMAFSGVWALFYAIAFIFMANSWRKSDEMFSFAKANIIGGIFFSFLSVFFWLGSVGLAYQRFKAGSDTAFSQGLGDETMGQDGSQYQGYQEEAGYSEAPFQGGGQQDIYKENTKQFEEKARLLGNYEDTSSDNIIKGYQPQQMQY